MTEDKFHDILTSIDNRLSEVWTAIDSIRLSSHKIEVRQTEKITRMEVQLAVNKWLIGLVVFQIIGWAFYMIGKLPWKL